MLPVSEAAIRASFVNCTKGEAKRLAVPKDLDEQPWHDLDFFGWRDPAALQRASLMTARKAGPEGRQGNSVGSYLCTDLACSLYLRGKKGAGQYLEETLTLEQKIERTRTSLAAFLDKVTS